MMIRANSTSAALCLAMLSLILTACALTGSKKLVIHQSTFRPGLQELMSTNRQLAEAPFTLAVLLDLQVVPCMLQRDIVYWPTWKRHMEDRGWGFVFMTARSDSIDVAAAVKLEGLKAQVLVLPGCEEDLSHLWRPWQFMPFKFLIDSSAAVRWVWPAVLDSVENEQFLARIDSVIALDSL